MDDTFPHDPDDLTCASLTRLVQSLHPKVEVVDFDVWENKTFAAGTDEVSTAGRIGVDVVLAGDGAEAINTRWMLKVCRPDLGDIPLYENEVSFYTRLRPEIEIEAPACFGGEYNKATGTFGIALEDLGSETRISRTSRATCHWHRSRRSSRRLPLCMRAIGRRLDSQQIWPGSSPTRPGRSTPCSITLTWCPT